MRLSKLIGRRVKEAPKDAQSASHIFLMRGGYIRPVSTGIYTLLPLAKRMTTKIENIIRQEMEAIDSQETMMPVVNPADINLDACVNVSDLLLVLSVFGQCFD